MLWICLEEDVCLYRPNARWGGEFEWLKTLQGPQLENCRKRLSFGVRKPLQNLSNSPYITTCCLGGFQEKNQEKKMLSPKNNLQHIQLSDTTGTSNVFWMFGSSNWTIIQKQTLKTTQKWVTGHKTKLLLWPFQPSDLNPVEMSEVNWREEAVWSESEGSGEILDEGMVSDLLSGVL